MDAPKGTIAVVEAQNQAIASLGRYGLQSPTGLIRMIVQQSNCFQVVERGAAMQNMMQERALAAGGQMQSDQDIGKGQVVSADFIVTPNVVFSEGNAGGGGGAALGGYTNTKEGKVITASFLDNWNNIVRAIRNNASLIQAKAGPASTANQAGSVQAGAAAEGDVMVAKIAGAKVLRGPADTAGVLISLTKTDEVLYLGEERNGFVKVTSPQGDGWVRKVLLKKP